MMTMTPSASAAAEYRRDASHKPQPGRGNGAAPIAKPVAFKTACDFVAEYVPLSYVLEGIVRTSSLYTMTARTGAGKTGLLVVTALAVATGRADIIGREVERGRVAYLAVENPDDIRMRIQIAAFMFGVDLGELCDDLVILDRREKPEAISMELAKMAKQKPFSLIIVDTLAAFFDGDDINNNVQAGQFMRRLRPFTQVAGLPAVIVAAHPIKSATEESLIPYGAGAVLNEVDGNLTLWKRSDSGIAMLHWTGKLRGLEFDPLPFRTVLLGCEAIVDVKGRQVQLPVMRPATEETADARADADADIARKLLLAMIDNPNGTQADWGGAIGRSKSRVNGYLQRLRAEKLADVSLNKWSVTPKGRRAAQCLS